MAGERLPAEEIERVTATWPVPVRRLGLVARDLVLASAPAVAEKIAFGALCYYKPDSPYGVIGGNVCMLDAKGEDLCLGFIHGAFLPDPEGLLRGSAKAKRECLIRDPAELKRPAVATLIRAAVAHDPASVES